MSPQTKSGVMLWIFGVVIAIITALSGAIYASMDKRIDDKADQSEVTLMRMEVHELWLMHIQQGYKIPESN